MKKNLLLILLLIGSCHLLYGQQKVEKGDTGSLRTSQVSAAEITYSYDTAGNRIKRVGSGLGSGCLNTWTGNVSASWNNAGNWSLGIVPQPCHTVVIPTLTGKPYPNLDVNSSVAGIDLTGGSINMNSFNISLSLDAGCATCP